ncbi:MAG: dihydropyrimidinase [Verrucomicrobiota bacterium]
MSLLIKNGEIVTASERRRADIYCEKEQIARIGPHLQVPAGAQVIDAAGRYVLPGFVDPHVHAYLPLKTTCSKDTYETASRAALMGGTTCFIDFCTPERGQSPLEALDLWDARSRGKSACDYSYHLAVTWFDAKAAGEIRDVVRRGITSFKIYLAYKGSVNIGDDELLGALKLARELGVVTMGHCEDAEAIDELQRKLLSEGKTGPEWHYHSRPPEIEARGTRRFLEFAGKVGAPAYVVHLSCEQALREAVAARQRGVKVWIETLISFLLLDRTYAELPNFEGAKYVVSPPLREKGNQQILWDSLRDGGIDTLSSDHAPFDFAGQKSLGRNDFTNIPNGMPTLEDRVNLLFTHGVKEGRMSLNRWVEAASTAPARIFGLYPRKGAIQVGSDADLVVYDPDYEGTISARIHSMNVDYNPFEGWIIRGRPSAVTVRGEVAVRDGTFVGAPGRGQFVARQPPA